MPSLLPVLAAAGNGVNTDTARKKGRDAKHMRSDRPQRTYDHKPSKEDTAKRILKEETGKGTMGARRGSGE